MKSLTLTDETATETDDDETRAVRTDVTQRTTTSSPLPPSTSADPDQDRRRLFGLSPMQVLAGALAAMTAALAASYLGVAGTLIGAALGSVVSTVGAALYSTSFRRAGEITTTRLRLVRPGEGSSLADPASLPPDLDRHAVVLADAEGRAEPTGSPVTAADAGTVPAAAAVAHRPATLHLPGWRVLTAAAAALFVLAMGAITATELVLGHPVANAGESGTSVSRVITGNAASSPKNDSRTTPTPTPSTSADAPSPSGPPSPSSSVTVTPGESLVPSQQPTDSPAPSQPAASDVPVPPGTASVPAPAAS